MIEHMRQQTFRHILDAMSFPGKVIEMENSTLNIAGLFPVTSLVCDCLLDQEVCFSVLGENNLLSSIHAYTGSGAVELKKADFIIVQLNGLRRLGELIDAKVGTLINPHNAATVICEIESLVEGIQYTISGPGVKGRKEINATIPEEFIKVRNSLNQEYPLGIDVIFVDSNNRLCTFPRTTQVVKGDAVWDMSL